jgi:nitroimidazol reductase NimA-like FMN-containing flavoprotein (pyridoxamine 5'-phosphate oxidase superfamily)
MGSIGQECNVTLTRAECLECLTGATVGHIGASIKALPVIMPVQFVVHGESVFFTTIPGSTLDAATIGAVVAFQADSYRAPLDTGWSVMLQGIASAVDEGDPDVPPMDHLVAGHDGAGPEPRLVRLDATTLSGHRLRMPGDDDETCPRPGPRTR